MKYVAKQYFDSKLTPRLSEELNKYAIEGYKVVSVMLKQQTEKQYHYEIVLEN